MSCFFIVTKVLMLKILLAFIAGLHGYDFGYHPSAEEFDNLMRETSRTWTRDLLANEHRRSWNAEGSSAHHEAGYFVPKYNHENTRNRYAGMLNDWPGNAQKLTRPLHHNRHDYDHAETSHHYTPHHEEQHVSNFAQQHTPSHLPYTQPPLHDQQIASSTNILSNGNVGSTLDFNMFSDESGAPIIHENLQQSTPSPSALNTKFVNNNIARPIELPSNTVTSSPVQVNVRNNTHIIPVKQNGGTVIQLETSSGEADAASVTFSQNQQSDNLIKAHNLKNQSDAQFPIFFTNPVTGIVYAITEVGKMQDKVQQSNGSIPIYVTKEQYDRDIYQLKQYYAAECHLSPPSSYHQEAPALTYSPTSASSLNSVISAPSNVTERPQIIRLQQPTKVASKLPIAKLPTTNLHRPPPVLIPGKLTVSNQVQLPAKRKKKPKTKRKNQKPKRRPGHKPTATPKPSFVATTTVSAPHFMLGTHTGAEVMPSISTQSLATQLEKPNSPATTTIFSNRPFVSTHGYMSPMSKTELTEAKISEDAFNPYRNHRLRKRSATNIRAHMEQELVLESHRDAQTAWIPIMQTLSSGLDMPINVGPALRRARKLPRGKRRELHKHHNNASEVIRKREKNKSTLTSTTSIPILQTTTAQTQAPLLTSTTPRQRPKSKKKKRKNSKRQNNDSGFDLFDFMEEEDDYDDDSYYEDYSEEEQKEEEAQDENTEEVAEENFTPVKIITKKPTVVITPLDYIDDGLKEELPAENSSTAEEGADFGALEEDQQKFEESLEDNLSSNTKNSLGKKRIRRRPPFESSASYEDYDDDDGGGGGVGGFFRMVFYPVQVFMTRIFDGFGDKDTHKHTPKYPTYTLYNNAVNVDDSAEDEEGGSLVGWFSSWFGFNRRTKKIGSTTTAPPPQAPPPTVEPGWFDSWFGYGGKTTTEASYEDYDDDKWFYGWFDSKPNRGKRRTTTTSTTTAQPTPQVPILTIVDPLRNPQNWIGILAHHIINSTTTTHNPLMEAITRATTTTTENPDIPRKISYDKYQIWRLKPQDDAQVRALEEFKKSEDGVRLQWLKGPSLRGLTDVLVPPKMLVDFQGSLNFEAIAHEVLIFDVGKAISYEKTKEQYYLHTTTRPQHKNSKYPPAPAMSWHKYHEYDDIISYLEAMRMRQPQMVELIHIGRSFEGRPLVIVKIASKETASTATVQAHHKKLKHKKKTNDANAVFIEAGAHGLEWIGPATSLWMINELLRIMKINSNKTSTEQEIIKNTTWYIMPILNPDGYVYTHEYDRFWKKSRSRHVSRPSGLITSAMTWLQQKKTAEKICFGVDLDRNWPHQWGKRGSSKSPCNELYTGPMPFSEPETKALSEFLMDYRKQIKLYIAMQSYGQIISYPIKANASYNSERIDDFLDVAMVGIDGLRKKGSKARYKIDTTNDLIENRSGCSDAFAAYEVGIPFSYTMQLADNGVHGYLLPSSAIEPTARDAFEIITAIVDYI